MGCPCQCSGRLHDAQCPALSLRPDQEICRYCQGNKRIISPQIKTLEFVIAPLPEIKFQEHWVTCPYCGGLGWRLVGVGR